MSSDDNQLHRDLGRLEGLMESHGEALEKITQKFDEYHEQNTVKLDGVIKFQERQKGAIGLVIILGSVFGAIAGLLVAFFRHA